MGLFIGRLASVVELVVDECNVDDELNALG